MSLKSVLFIPATSLKHIGNKLKKLIYILFRAALVDHAALRADLRRIGARHLRRGAGVADLRGVEPRDGGRAVACWNKNFDSGRGNTHD